MHVDMDGVRCYAQGSLERPEVAFPQSQLGFFVDLPKIEGVIVAVNELREVFGLYILSTPSTRNPFATPKVDFG